MFVVVTLLLVFLFSFSFFVLLIHMSIYVMSCIWLAGCLTRLEL